MIASLSYTLYGENAQWRQALFGLHIIPDLIIGTAFLSISIAMLIVLRKRSDIEFRFFFILLTLFIFISSLIHFLGILSVWPPIYYISGWIKVACALFSALIASAHWALLPKVIQYPTRHEYKLQLKRAQKAEERLRFATAAGRMGVWDYFIQEDRLEWDQAMFRLYQVEPRDFSGTYEAWSSCIHSDDLRRAEAEFQEAVQGGKPFDCEFRIVLGRNRERHIFARAEVKRDSEGNAIRIVGVNWDITQQKYLEEQKKESELQFRNAFNASAGGFAIISPSGDWLDVNRALCQIIGYSHKELLSFSFHSITHPEDRQKNSELLEHLTQQKIPYYNTELRYIQKDGNSIWVELSVSVVRHPNGRPKYFTLQITDIDRYKKAENKLKSSLEEKNVLLKEVHHRVKNNLQLVISLLRLQERKLRTTDLEIPLKESQMRIRSMALVHEQLQQADNLAVIELSDHLQQLTQILSPHQQSENNNHYTLHTHFDPCPVDLQKAIPLGLIANELISNAFKHGVDEKGNGNINIELHKKSQQRYQFEVSNEGSEIPEAVDPFDNQSSLGLNLVQRLAQQIRGKVTLERSPRTKFSIDFLLGDEEECLINDQ
ncbi:MAG: PAS domain-containing protein [Verrucomicrobiota bacterium]